VERLMTQRLREKRLEAALEAQAPHDAEDAAHYKSNSAAFTRPARRQVAMTRREVPATASDEARQARRGRAQAASRAAAALAGDVAHFGAVAVAFSDDRSAR